MKIIDTVCEHMPVRRRVWSDPELEQEALKYLAEENFRQGILGHIVQREREAY